MKYVNPIVDGLHALYNNVILSTSVSLVGPQKLNDYISMPIDYPLGIPSHTDNNIF
jgi:hypothetical protein